VKILRCLFLRISLHPFRRALHALKCLLRHSTVFIVSEKDSRLEPSGVAVVKPAIIDWKRRIAMVRPSERLLCYNFARTICHYVFESINDSYRIQQNELNSFTW
jgi:hypothetical protein